MQTITMSIKQANINSLKAALVSVVIIVVILLLPQRGRL